MKSITERDLKFARRARSLRRLTLHADGGAFELRVSTAGEEDLTLVTMRKADGASVPRRFDSPVAALALLFKLGIHEVNVNLEHWQPKEKDSARRRPDSAALMKEAHEALAEKKRNKPDTSESTTVVPPPQDEGGTINTAQASGDENVKPSAGDEKPSPIPRKTGIHQVEIRTMKGYVRRDVTQPHVDSGDAPGRDKSTINGDEHTS
ncbi:hypothetical protein [Burkholderia sp. 9120]|uniref:hypothetical protein n=1 Tax=Burkholderia sp. 9120 TaxID=1500897 RepID=UPI0012DFF141|nr:hypothetical protein [Burkholderia sp. 9120]